MYKKETKKAMQDAYHESRSHGHTKEEARKIRDNWKVSKPTIDLKFHPLWLYISDDDDDDDDFYTKVDEVDDTHFDDDDY